VDKGESMSLEEVRQYADKAIDKEGTRLCLIEKVDPDSDMAFISMVG